MPAGSTNAIGVFTLQVLDTDGQPLTNVLTSIRPYLSTGQSLHVLSGHRYQLVGSARDDQGNFKEVFRQVVSE